MSRLLRNNVALMVVLGLIAAGCSRQPAASEPESGGSKKPVVLNEKQQMLFATAFLNASKAKILGNYELALSLYNDAIRIDPESDAAYYDMARILSDGGQFPQAISYARQAYAIDLENMWYAEFLGRLYAETNDFSSSIDVFRAMINKHPERVEYYFQLGSVLAAQGKYDEALKLYNDLEKRIGVNEELGLQKQLLYIEKGDYELALKEVNALITLNPEATQLYGMKAEIYERQGKKDLAIEIYEEMLVIEPANGLVLLSLYELHMGKAGDDAKANGYLERAFVAPDLGIDVKINVLLTLLSRPDYTSRGDQIITLAQKLELAHPEDAKTYAIQGDVLFNLNRPTEAREKFRKAVEIDPNRPPIWQQILSIDSQLSDFSALLTESEKAIDLFPEIGLFYLFQGIALSQDKKYSEAIESFELGKNLIVDNNVLLAQLHASLGDAYHELNDHANSDKAYESSLKYDPKNAFVLNNFAYYLSLRKVDLEKAEAMAKKANDLNPDVASFQDTYGWVLYTRQNYQNALFWIEQALQNGASNDPTVLDHYGEVLLQLNRKADAVSAWEKALSVGGNEAEIAPKISKAKSL